MGWKRLHIAMNASCRQACAKVFASEKKAMRDAFLACL